MIEPARPEDLASIESLLTSCGLPVDGVREHLGGFLVARDESGLIGCCAMEAHGRSGVLRSLAVIPAQRGRGLGSRLIDETLALAGRLGCSDIYLLTFTIENLAARHGFRRISRENVSPEALASREFSITVCATAAVMHLPLPRSA